MNKSLRLLVHILGILLIDGCHRVSAGNENDSDTVDEKRTTAVDSGDLETELLDASYSTDSLMNDTVHTETSSDLNTTDILFNQWHLSALVYSGETQDIDPDAQNPMLEILRDEEGNTVINVSSCYEQKEDYCELISQSEIRCSGYRRHSIIWGDEPFPCSQDEMAIETRFYLSMEAVSNYELQGETLVLYSDDGNYEILFEL